MQSVAAIVALLLTGTATLSTAATLPLEACQLSAAKGLIAQRAQCGTLLVAENPALPEGRQIPLNVAIIRSRSNEPAADPVFFFAGGPGQAAITAFPAAMQALQQAAADRDVILIDQRGTGGSNPLRCPPPEDINAMLQTPAPGELERFTAECLAQLDADPRFYTTAIAVSDFDQVRASLGYQQINLLGVSYGTRVAQQYLRQYPQHVRSVILDGVVPSELILGLEHDTNLEQALNETFSACHQDSDCTQRFPDLSASYQNLRQQVAEHPVTITVPLPASGTSQELIFNRQLLTLALRILAYSSENRALLPLLVHEAAHSKDYERLGALALMILQELNQSIYAGLETSVMCAEEVPFYPTEIAPRDTLMGDSLITLARQQCALWPHGTVAEDFHSRFTSTTPVLLLSGQYDPVTPPRYGELAVQQYASGLHLVVPGEGHNVSGRGCVPELIADFISTAVAGELDTSCLENMGATPFFTTLTGAEP
ncbi:alpha/beta hydrolase [Candidatus Litorirhabdus singularis]|uniref:alpha/beta hydrolase n=1 Tax=Candidatus Litorirhabdus singularis TaxID=2518993 RepID=UPI00242B904B|nr:alpha/beta hydrolase [Candidatus Litorirhabdus singularis]